MLRSEVRAGQFFYLNSDPRSLCLAIADNEATERLRDMVGRNNIAFHVHKETSELSYTKRDTQVLKADNF